MSSAEDKKIKNRGIIIRLQNTYPVEHSQWVMTELQDLLSKISQRTQQRRKTTRKIEETEECHLTAVANIKCSTTPTQINMKPYTKA